ncbi:MAG: hypothetical protein HKN26_17285 [Acidimicrobiales bacterium]|nr:hypothetical protein [Acidimicrobiales bacterium]
MPADEDFELDEEILRARIERWAPNEELSAGLEQLEVRAPAPLPGGDTSVGPVLDYDEAYRELVEMIEAEAYAIERREDALLDIDRLTLAQALERKRLIELRGEEAELALDLDDAETALRGLAVRSFVHAGGDDELEVSLDPSELRSASSPAEFADQLADSLASDRDRLAERLITNRRVQQATVNELADLAGRKADAANEAENQQVLAYEAALRLPELGQALSDARWTSLVVGLDMSIVVLDAYVRAARSTSAERPGCNIEWWMLAGIGRVESGHGTFGGTRVGADGRTLDEIIGIPLDGTNGTALITDTDGGVIDLDVVFDRAVGPMQFIPGTWSFIGTDGDEDELIDPHNIYDAAATAARYLCTSGDLQAPDILARAYFSYNHDLEYVAKVTGFAQAYRQFPIPS